jgi:hypothetical protein
MTVEPKDRDTLSYEKQELSALSMEVPLVGSTIGYPNTVKATIAGQVIDLHGPIKLVAAPGSDPEHRMSIKWNPESSDKSD